MLVLERTEGKRIFIGNDIVLTLEEIKADCVLLSVDAPAEKLDFVPAKSIKRKSDSSTIQLTMLARNESLKLDGNIKIAYIRSRGSTSALIGINAPQHIPVWREELVRSFPTNP